MPSPWCFNSLCTGMARDGVKVPLHGNRTNLHGHLPGVHGHVCTVAGKFSGTVMRVAQPLPCNFSFLRFHRRRHLGVSTCNSAGWYGLL